MPPGVACNTNILVLRLPEGIGIGTPTAAAAAVLLLTDEKWAHLVQAR